LLLDTLFLIVLYLVDLQAAASKDEYRYVVSYDELQLRRCQNKI